MSRKSIVIVVSPTLATYGTTCSQIQLNLSQHRRTQYTNQGSYNTGTVEQQQDPACGHQLGQWEILQDYGRCEGRTQTIQCLSQSEDESAMY